MDNQSLQTFQQFVSFVKNIDNYTKIVEQIKTATTAHDAAFDRLTQGKTLAQFQAKLDEVKARLDLERVEFDKACKAQNEAFASRTKVLDATESALNDQRGFQDANRQLLDEKFAEVEKRASDLDRREQDLNARDAANNAVAADLASRLALIKQAGA